MISPSSARISKKPTVEGDVKGEPAPGGTEEHLEVLPLPEVARKVSPRSLGQLGALVVVDGVDDVCAGGEVRVDVLGALLDVALDVHGVPRGLRDGESEVERNCGGDHAETDDESPDLVDRLGIGERFSLDLSLEGSEDNDGDDGRCDWREQASPWSLKPWTHSCPTLGQRTRRSSYGLGCAWQRTPR